MSNPKPLTNAQRRAATRLLEQEEARLWQEYNQQYSRGDFGHERQAREEWLAANPDYVDIVKRAEKYAKRVHKRFAEFADEVETLLPGITTGRAYVSVGLDVYYDVPHSTYVNSRAQKKPWGDRQAELYKEWETKRAAVYAAIQERIETGKRNILLATVGDADPSLYTLPTLGEIEASV